MNMPAIHHNKPLADRHRVGLGGWPICWNNPRLPTWDAVVNHLVAYGYEGMEHSAEFLAMFFPGDSLSVVARKVEQTLAAKHLRCFGSFVWIRDEEYERLTTARWRQARRDELQLVVDIGGQYANCNYVLPAQYQNTAGDYRDDAAFLDRAAGLIGEFRDMAHDMGLNFYVEVHNGYITEDPAATCRLFDRVAFETTADLSHYHCRGITRGAHLDRIRAATGHVHGRLSRLYGDLSAWVDDPKTDWDQKGVTWQLFQITRPCLERGVSSRVIIGESGPIFEVRDALSLDVKLLPLWRAMATYADAAAQGVVKPVIAPGDLRPWG